MRTRAALLTSVAVCLIGSTALAQSYVYRYQVKGASTVQTGGADTTPDAFSVAAVGGAARGAVVTSAPIALTGFQANSAATVSGTGSPQFSTDGGATWVTAGTISPNQTVLLRLTADSAVNGVRTATFSVGGVSSTWTVTTEAGDTVPNAFALIDVSGAAPSTQTTAAAVTPTGYDAPTAIGVSGDGSAQLSVAGGAWGTSGTINPGQSFQVRATSSASFGGAVNVTVTVGGVSDTWTLTTRAADTTPDAFAIAAVPGAEMNTVVTSGAITPVGYTEPASVAVSGDPSAQVAINGGAWGTSGTINPGQSFQLRVTSAAAAATAKTVTVTVGGVAQTWSVTTRALDAVPDAFTFTALTGQAGSTQVTSGTITPTGYTDPTSVSVSGQGSPQISIAGGGWTTSGTLNPGQSLQARLTTGPTDGATLAATVTVGGVNAVWNVTTKDTIPGAYSIAALTEQELSARVTSAAVTPSGYDSPTAIAVTGDGSPQISVAGGAYTGSATINPGQSFTVQMTTSASNATASTATVTIGGVTATFTATTKEAASAGPTTAGSRTYNGYGNVTIGGTSGMMGGDVCGDGCWIVFYGVDANGNVQCVPNTFPNFQFEAGGMMFGPKYSVGNCGGTGRAPIIRVYQRNGQTCYSNGSFEACNGSPPTTKGSWW